MEKTIRKYSTLEIPNTDQLLYGICLHPLQCGLGLTIGGGPSSLRSTSLCRR
jgi:hypothetical protein